MKEETQDSQQREYKETKPPKSVLLLVKSLIPGTRRGRSTVVCQMQRTI